MASELAQENYFIEEKACMTLSMTLSHKVELAKLTKPSCYYASMTQ